MACEQRKQSSKAATAEWLQSFVATSQSRSYCAAACVIVFYMDLRHPVTFCSYQNIFELTVFFSLTVFANQHVIWGSQRSLGIFMVFHFCRSFSIFSNFPGSHFHMLNCSGEGESLWSDFEVIPRISDPERIFSPDKRSSFFLPPKVYFNTEFESKKSPTLLCSMSNNIWSVFWLPTRWKTKALGGGVSFPLRNTPYS